MQRKQGTCENTHQRTRPEKERSDGKNNNEDSTEEDTTEKTRKKRNHNREAEERPEKNTKTGATSALLKIPSIWTRVLLVATMPQSVRANPMKSSNRSSLPLSHPFISTRWKHDVAVQRLSSGWRWRLSLGSLLSTPQSARYHISASCEQSACATLCPCCGAPLGLLGQGQPVNGRR